MIIVGLSGNSGSGKTHLIELLKNKMGDKITILSCDNYYKPIQFQQKDINGIENFDLPEGIDIDAFLRDLKALRQGKTLTQKLYHFNNPNAQERWTQIKPAPIIFIEGLFIFHFDEIFNLMDYKIFVNAPHDITYRRRVIRDKEERGISEEMTAYQYTHHALPGYEKYVFPYREQADIVIENNQNDSLAFETLLNFIEQLRAQQ